MKNRAATIAAVGAFFLIAFAAAFFLRGMDDNSLFSWSWAFAAVDASQVYLCLILGLVVASLLARVAVPPRYDAALLALLSFAAVLPLWNEPEIIIDASRYFTQAKHLELYGPGYFVKEWGGAIPAWTDLPLVPFLYGLIFKVFAESRASVQAFTTILFSLTTVLTYLTGKKLWGRETGFAAALLLLGIPYLLTQVPLMLVDVPTMFFLMLAVFTFLDAIDRGGPTRICCSIVSILCCVLSKYSAWFMLSVLAVIVVAYDSEGTAPDLRARRKRGYAVLLASAALSGGVLLLKYDVVSRQIVLLRTYQQPGLGRWGESFFSSFFFQVHPFVTILALASAAVAVRNRERNYPIIGWLILLVVFFNIKRIRYILPVFPMLTLMAGYGLQVVKDEFVRRFILYGTVAASLVIAFFAFLPFARTMSAENLKSAGAYLDTLASQEIQVITLPPGISPANPAVSVPLLDLFTSKRIRYRYRPEAFPPKEEVRVSPLRFTWEYRNPDYYSGESVAICSMPVLVLSEMPVRPLPKRLADDLSAYRLVKEFTAGENIFQYTVAARIYEIK